MRQLRPAEVHELDVQGVWLLMRDEGQGGSCPSGGKHAVLTIDMRTRRVCVKCGQQEGWGNDEVEKVESVAINEKAK